MGRYVASVAGNQGEVIAHYTSAPNETAVRDAIVKKKLPLVSDTCGIPGYEGTITRLDGKNSERPGAWTFDETGWT